MANQMAAAPHTDQVGRHSLMPSSFFARVPIAELFIVAAHVVPYVPSRLGYVLCEMLGATIGPRLPTWQHVLANLHITMPAASAAERRAAAYRVMIRFFKNYFDLFRFPTLSPEALKHTMVVEGLEHVQRALAGGRGLLAVAPHCGNYTALVGPVVQHFGTPALLVVERMADPRIHQLINRMRQLPGVDVQPLGPMIGRSILQVLRKNQAVVLAGDRAIAANTLMVNFFGRPTPIPSGPATLALRTGVPVVPCFTHRLSDNRSLAYFDPPLVFKRSGNDSQAVHDATQQIATIMEAYIRRDPSQWMVAESVWPNP
jgi:lauroyl/myristoyl acyltransferase